jgi:cardiolipin synthase
MVAFYEQDAVRRFAQWIGHQQASAMPYRAQPPGFWRELAEGLMLWLAFQL